MRVNINLLRNEILNHHFLNQIIIVVFLYIFHYED